ncbi:hypothetical protein BN1051_03057 [Arthrobacter saudimassiliensis]|uniref:Uncharacterized protein n=1 Tax=Arthrobacter saudimassiliensis TaxID=1461584 RepID=A0A078MTM4_9MICC|nr:hypothetical protein BN1051_03057 [Arthrobacter saudimassiliensis]
MILTRDDTISDTGLDAGFGAGRCVWDESVCVDKPTHFVTSNVVGGAAAEVYCLRHYVLTLAGLCELHLPNCEGDFSGHVLSHGEL